MPWRRIWIFLFCLVLVGLWVFPRVETRFVSWNNDVHDWDSFAISHSRPFIADVRLESRRSSFSEIYPEKTIQERRALIPRWASSWLPMYRQTAIDWAGQCLQTFLAVAFFLGLRWAGKAKSAPSISEDGSKSRRFMNRMLQARDVLLAKERAARK